jgi:hypothetical protein
MPASRKQIGLIGKLQDLGAEIPCTGEGGNPDFSMLDSVQAADAYIKKWGYLNLATKPGATATAQDWGGVSNH